MSELVDDQEDEVIDQNEPEIESEPTETVEDSGNDQELVLTIGEEAPPQEEKTPAPAWVKDLRKAHREAQKELRELRAKVNTSAPIQKLDPIGAKPTLEACEYDSAKYETALETWYEKKRKVDDQQAEEKKAKEKADNDWNMKLQTHETSKKALKVTDFEDAEEVVQTTFDVNQQGIIIHGSDNSAKLMYVLGKSPSKAKELASIKDPIKFAFAVAKIETQIRETMRNGIPAPEKKITGSGPVTGSSDATLERLRAEAEKTGDFSKVTAYKRSKR